VGFSNLFPARVRTLDGDEAVLDSAAGSFHVIRLPWFETGREVCFGIRSEEILIGAHNGMRPRPSAGDHEIRNRFSGELVRLTNLGLHLLGVIRGAVDLQIIVPRHVQDTVGLRVGQKLTVTLERRYIHVLPAAE
jgi:molybdate transport system ATP-binding protein